jgi:sigma-B regulation protein RsbU (phosphoserine phosphatase)
MKLASLAGEPEWKRFLRLGEQLRSQVDAAAQCRLITEMVTSLLGCQARMWLAAPYYPLPGQAEVPVLPDASAPEPVQTAWQEKEICCRAQVGLDSSANCSAQNPTRSAAFPLLTDSELLGIMLVERLDGPAFRKEEISFLEALAAHAAVAMQVSRQAVLKNWRSEQLALVRKVSSQIANVPDLDELCERVARLIQDTFHYYEVGIFTLEPNEQELCLRASARQGPGGLDAPYLGEGIIGEVALSGKEIIALDVSSEARFRFTDYLPETKSEATFPIKIEGKVLGVLDVESDQTDAFHDVDVLVLQSLADTIAVAVEGARLYNSQKKRAEQLAVLFEVSHVLTSILDMDALLQEVVRIIHKSFGFPFVHLFIVHPRRNRVVYAAGSGARSEAMRDQEIEYDLNEPTGIIPWVARNNQSYLANQVQLDTLYRPSPLPPLNTRAEMAVPLAMGDQVQAVLDLQSDQINAFDQDDINLFETLAGSIAISIRNATLYRSEKWRRQVGESIRDVAGLLSGNVALEKLLDAILLELERNLPSDAAGIWLLDSPGASLRLAAAHGVAAEKIIAARESSSEVSKWLEQALDWPEPIIRQSTDPYGPLGAALELPPDYSSIAAPLRIGDQPIGVLTLANRQTGRFGDEARLMTATFASYAATAIQNARLYADAQEQAWVSTILLQVAEASQSVTTPDELFSTMVRLTRLLVGIKKCGMFQWDGDQQVFVLKSWYGLERKPPQLVFASNQAPAFARLRKEQRVIFIQDARQELNMPAAAIPVDLGHLVLLPLLARDQLLGALLVAHQPDAGRAIQDFEGQVLVILQGIAHQTAVTLENLRLLEARQEEAYVTAVLLQVAQAVVSQNDLVDILDTVVNLMPILIGIDACLIFLWDRHDQVFHTARAMTGSRETDEQITGQSHLPGEFLLLDCVRLKDSAFFCALPDPNMPPSHWKDLDCSPMDQLEGKTSGPHDHWLLGFPLSVKGEVLGVLLAREAGLAPAFQERRLEIIHGIAQQVALSIQNERLKRETLARERLENEFDLARTIQTNFLPDFIPVRRGWEIAARWQTARQVGGDFYDVFPLGKDRLGLAIGDVSDKGMPAALYMTVARTLIRAYARTARTSSLVLKRVNDPLVNDTPNSMFVTAAYGILWPETGELMYANAGHNLPLIVRACSGVVEQLPKGGMAIGVMERIQLDDHRCQIDPGDVLLFYTDGVTESFSPQGEAFGEQRLMRLMANCCGNSAQDLLEILQQALIEFRGGMPASDDMTLLAVRRLE